MTTLLHDDRATSLASSPESAPPLGATRDGLRRIKLNAPFRRFLRRRIPVIGDAAALPKFKGVRAGTACLDIHGDEQIKLLKKFIGTADDEYR